MPDTQQHAKWEYVVAAVVNEPSGQKWALDMGDGRTPYGVDGNENPPQLLKKLGAQGWELAAIHPDGRLILKRPLLEPRRPGQLYGF